MMPKPVYFYHIMKTAGTAINYAFFSSSGENAEIVYNILNKKGNYSAGSIKFTRRIEKIKSGYFTYGFSHEPYHKLNLSTSHFTFTCLRDPYDRILSIWNALLTEKSRGNHRPGHKWLGRSFSDFLNKMPATVLNGHIWMFSRNLNVDEALKNLYKCNMILLYEKIDEDIEKLGKATDWHLDLKRVNVSETHKELSGEDKENLMHKLTKEYEFYKRARKKVLNVG